MNFRNSIFAILAIFCIMFSVFAVSAADDVSNQDSDYYLNESYDEHVGYIIPPDFVHNEEQGIAAGRLIPYCGDEPYPAEWDAFDNCVPFHADGTDPADVFSDDQPYPAEWDAFDNCVPFHADGTDPTA